MVGAEEKEYSCSNCANEGTKECKDCSVVNDDDDFGCMCHTNPPCWFCENNHFEDK